MTADIIPLPGVRRPAQPIAHYLRIGDTGHRQLDTMLAERQFIAKRVVVDASRLKHQLELIKSLQSAGVEIILDTKAAELSVLGKYQGYNAYAPWGNAADGKPLGPDHFKMDGPGEVIRHIARCAVENKLHAVLAPAHWLKNASNDSWFKTDREACFALRKALDQEEGANIVIDYPLLISHTDLRDEAIRGALVERLADLPYDNLWIRASGFGNDGTPAGARHYINALSGFHNLGKPIIADYVGGLIGLATVALGVAGGIANGLGEKQRFQASSWDKRPVKKEDSKGGGRRARILIPNFDKSLTIQELKSLAKAKGGNRLVVCHDRDCCPHGLEDTIKNPKRHTMKQYFGSVNRLETIPDFNRAQDFLDNDLARADRQARQIKALKPLESELIPRGTENISETCEKLVKRLNEWSRRNEKMRGVLEDLYETRGKDTPRASAAAFRGDVSKYYGRM